MSLLFWLLEIKLDQYSAGSCWDFYKIILTRSLLYQQRNVHLIKKIKAIVFHD